MDDAALLDTIAWLLGLPLKSSNTFKSITDIRRDNNILHKHSAHLKNQEGEITEYAYDKETDKESENNYKLTFAKPIYNLPLRIRMINGRKNLCNG